MLKNKNLKTIILIAFPLILAAYMLLRYVNLPYVGPNATDQNKLSMIARNYNYFGLFETKFQPIILPYKTLPDKPQLYFNHGVLMEIVTSFFMKTFGYDFWVGRIPYIIAAFLILPVLFFIGKEGKNKQFGILSLIVAVLIPATSVFGRTAHYQGSFSVLFTVATGYFALMFVQTKNKKFLSLAIISGILGVLTDWPITYFSLFLLPLFLKNRLKKEGVILSAFIIGAGILLLSYINNFIPIFGGLTQAITNRSLGPQLTSVDFWQIKWIGVIFLRLLIYFNPIFILFSGIYTFRFLKRLKEKKLNNPDLLTFALLAVGFTYIIIFPEGSFSHPNWMYGLVPGITLATAGGIFPFIKKRLFWIALILILSIIYVLIIENWKTNQNLANLYRYNLAKGISKYLAPYETVAVNRINQGNIIDFDLFNYAFLVNAKQFPAFTTDFKGINHYVFSCICDLSNNQVNFLANRYNFIEYYSPPGTAFIFFLDQRQEKNFPLKEATAEKKVYVQGPKENFPKKLYRLIITYLNLPQL